MKDRIRELRTALNLTQDEFSKSLKLSQNYIWMIEKGQRNITDRSISDLVRIYNVNEEWLRTGKGEMFLEKTYEDEVSYFLNQVVHADPDDPRVELMHILAKLPMEDWKLVSDFIDVIIESGIK